MTVAPVPEPAEVVIDDLTFADLLRLSLEEVPGASQGRWTVHGDVDPGVTVLQLFAWQLEQRLFMAEQVTDPVIRASLRLLGISDPPPTRAATTILCFQPTASPVELPAGTLMTLDQDASFRGFTLDEPVVVLPMGPVHSVGQLRGAGDTLEFQHSYSGPVLNDQPVNLLIDVLAAPGVVPEWSTAAADVPAAAELRWTAVGPDGSEMAVAVTDGTAGFRRCGLLRLAWPKVWNAIGAEPCRLRARAIRGSYTEIVRVRGAYPNAVRASDRQHRTEDVTGQVQSFLPLPGQHLTLPGTAGQLLDGAGEVSLTITEHDNAQQTWTPVPDWTLVGPGDGVFVADRARGVLYFGDGRAGRILRAAPGTAATISYAIGGGPLGNVGARRSWIADAGVKASNPLAADGGADAETIESAEQRAAGDLALADRTVTAEDARQLVLATPGVGLQRAHPTPGLHPKFPCAEVSSALSFTVVPHADRDGAPTEWTRAPYPDDGALAAARAWLQHRRLIGQEVFVLPPVYRRVTVRATISQTSRDQAVGDRVTDALLRYLDPLRGGSDKEGWQFGAPVRPSALIAVVRKALGPESDVVSLSVALDDGPGSDCADLTIGSRELVWLAEAPQLRWAVTVPAGGGLS